MAGIMDMIMGAQDGEAIQKLASQFGLGQNDATSAVKSLLPALTDGIQQNLQKQGGAKSLLSALEKGDHRRYIQNAGTLTSPEAVDDGNRILGHILGSKEVSRNVAAKAAQESGVDSGVLKKMLPVIATMVMGSMSQQSKDSGILGALTGGGSSDPGGAADLLSSFLGGGGESSGGGLMDMAKKLF